MKSPVSRLEASKSQPGVDKKNTIEMDIASIDDIDVGELEFRQRATAGPLQPGKARARSDVPWLIPVGDSDPPPPLKK